MKIAIIGGGPAGLMAALSSKDEVYLFEKNSDVGKKLLLTGNGRCNYWNSNQDISKYHSTNQDILGNIINSDNLNKVYKKLEDMGIVPIIKNGYYYPYSLKSSSVKSLLKQSCLNNGVHFIYDIDINNIDYKNNKFIINGDEFAKVIIATGAKSYSKTGSDGMGYILAKKFGHTITEINPSLVQVITNTGLEKSLSGIRAEVKVSHFENNHVIKEENGEIQFTDYGLSGICIFNLSRDIRIGLNKNNQESVHINFVPWCSNILDYLNKLSIKYPKSNISELSDGFMDYKLVNVILKSIHVDATRRWADLNKQEKELFANTLTDYQVDIIDTKGYENAQTCSGGIPLSEINPNTMESIKCKGLYFAGEILDVDGDCGGYNLTFAFLSGYLAGDSHD